MKARSIFSWTASVLVHACVGAAMCLAYRGQARASEPAVALVQLSGQGEVDAGAAEAVRGWSFRRALRAGTRVEGEFDIPIRLRLADG